MTPRDKVVMGLLFVVLAQMIATCVLFVAFGEVTVRRLRKNPHTRDLLGVEFASGWDILNVAWAVSLPRNIARRFDHSVLAGLHANSDRVYANTSVFDRVLGRLYFYSMWLFMLWLAAWMLADRWL